MREEEEKEGEGEKVGSLSVPKEIRKPFSKLVSKIKFMGSLLFPTKCFLGTNFERYCLYFEIFLQNVGKFPTGEY